MPRQPRNESRLSLLSMSFDAGANAPDLAGASRLAPRTVSPATPSVFFAESATAPVSAAAADGLSPLPPRSPSRLARSGSTSTDPLDRLFGSSVSPAGSPCPFFGRSMLVPMLVPSVSQLQHSLQSLQRSASGASGALGNWQAAHQDGLEVGLVLVVWRSACMASLGSGA